MKKEIIIIIIICLVLIIVLNIKKDKKITKISINNHYLEDDRIKLYSINNFLSDEECDYFVKVSEGNFKDSKVVQGKNANVLDKNYRTSKSYYIPVGDKISYKIKQKVGKMLGKGVECIEDLQVVRYLPGEEFKEHHDWFHKEYRNEIKNQREYTIFVYLNDVEEGGETNFPRIGKQFKPVKGKGLFWKNCDEFDKCNDLNLHQGKAPTKGVKYGLNIWIRFK